MAPLRWQASGMQTGIGAARRLPTPPTIRASLQLAIQALRLALVVAPASIAATGTQEDKGAPAPDRCWAGAVQQHGWQARMRTAGAYLAQAVALNTPLPGHVNGQVLSKPKRMQPFFAGKNDWPAQPQRGPSWAEGWACSGTGQQAPAPRRVAHNSTCHAGQAAGQESSRGLQSLHRRASCIADLWGSRSWAAHHPSVCTGSSTCGRGVQGPGGQVYGTGTSPSQKHGPRAVHYVCVGEMRWILASKQEWQKPPNHDAPSNGRQGRAAACVAWQLAYASSKSSALWSAMRLPPAIKSRAPLQVQGSTPAALTGHIQWC